MPRMGLILALGIAAAACTTNGPAKNVVRLITHSSPGGGSDVFLREMAPHLSRIMGATFVVDNLQGGSGAKAMATLARAKPDGGMFYATTPTFIYTSLLSRPAATLHGPRAAGERVLRPRGALHGRRLAGSRRFGDVIDQRAQGRRQVGRGQPGVARAPDAGAAEAEGRRRARGRHLRRRRRHAASTC